MFKRSPKTVNRGRGDTESTPKRDPKIPLDPVDELFYLYNRLSCVIDKSKKEGMLADVPVASQRSGRKGRNLFRPKSNKDENEIMANNKNINESSTNNTNSSSNNVACSDGNTVEDARFFDMEEDECVEIIRRIAELVVIGEKVVANKQFKQDKRKEIEKKNAWGDEIDDERVFLPSTNVWDDDPFGSEKYLPVFETFFEINGLALLVDLITGVSFDDDEEETQNNNLEMPNLKSGKEDAQEQNQKTIESPKSMEGESGKRKSNSVKRLPPIRIATQAVQSLAILVQNVSKATSLYFILSNNHINELIKFQLNLYAVALANSQNGRMEGNEHNLKAAVKPEIQELTTHFVTFLKSLAMRMNAETLQFFLQYPDDIAAEEFNAMQEGRPSSGLQKGIKIQFPLFARALDFCVVEHDSMVRLTAMNICLNTLRLTTIAPNDNTDDKSGEQLGSSPDGVLYNAKSLPLRERLAIAQHICAPSKVERLVSPIFTKLTALWSSLEDQFISYDFHRSDISSDEDKKVQPGAKNRIKKAEQAIRDIGADIQDQLLVLEDVLKVGLTALNEQVLEMMLATVVYPLLLQPLIISFGRLPLDDKTSTNDPFLAQSTQQSDLSTTEEETKVSAHVVAPAKTALFTIASVFQFITNRPLLRLMFTALFHPLAPNRDCSENLVSPETYVTSTNEKGETVIRVDKVSSEDSISDDRMTYPFGDVSSCLNSRPTEGDCCTFVMSPALAKLLRYGEEQVRSKTNLRLNPYRRAFLQSLCAPHFMSDLKCLSVSALDAALCKFDDKFIDRMFFSNSFIGISMDDISSSETCEAKEEEAKEKEAEEEKAKEEAIEEAKEKEAEEEAKEKVKEGDTKEDDAEQDESEEVDTKEGDAKVDEVEENPEEDVNGSGLQGDDTELTPSKKSPQEETAQCNIDLIDVLCDCVMNPSQGPFGTWKLLFDDVAAHCLLNLVWKKRDAQKIVAKRIERRWQQSALLFSEIPPRIPTVQNLGFIVHSMFYETKALVGDLFLLDKSYGDKGDLYTDVSSINSFEDLCYRATTLPPASSYAGYSKFPDEATLTNIGVVSARSLVKLDAFSSLLNTIAKTDGNTILEVARPAGLTFYSDGTQVDVSSGVFDLKTQSKGKTFSPISVHFRKLLTDSSEQSSQDVPCPGSSIVLTGATALPCVCEKKIFDFSSNGTQTVSEGIGWQSLYLVFSGSYMILAEPYSGKIAGPEGKVVTAVQLARMGVKKDIPPAGVKSTARRLVLHHEWLSDVPPPPLFEFNKAHKENKFGNLCQLKMERSSLDIWFENETACDHAFRSFCANIITGKTRHGDDILDYLSQNQL